MKPCKHWKHANTANQLKLLSKPFKYCKLCKQNCYQNNALTTIQTLQTMQTLPKLLLKHCKQYKHSKPCKNWKSWPWKHCISHAVANTTASGSTLTPALWTWTVAYTWATYGIHSWTNRLNRSWLCLLPVMLFTSFPVHTCIFIPVVQTLFSLLY